MKKKHRGFDLAGIITIYFFSGFFATIFLIEAFAYLEDEGIAFLFIGLFCLLVLVMTILYHLNRIQNYVLISILGFIVSIVGGILILVGQLKQRNANKNKTL